MTVADTSYGTAYEVDLTAAFPDVSERHRLIEWGARYLSDASEDRAIRTAHLALELAALLWRQNKRRARRMSQWQVRLSVLAMITECVRFRSRQLMEGDNHVRH